jgi:hypothetical protein
MTTIKSKYGHDVEISHVHFQEKGRDVISITGVCEDKTHEHRVTFGAVDGLRPNIDFNELQNEFDRQKQICADEVGWKKKLSDHVKQLK